MDSSGACYSLDGVSLTGRLNSTRYTPSMPSLDGTPVLTLNQKLDHLLTASVTQANQLSQATSERESTQDEVKNLAAQVTMLKEQLHELRSGKSQSGATRKRPRSVSVSQQLALKMNVSLLQFRSSSCDMLSQMQMELAGKLPACK